MCSQKWSCSVLLQILVLCALSAAASASNITVTTRDSRISYAGQWVDQDNGGHKFTGTYGSSFNFTFQGSAIYYFTMVSVNGGVAAFVVDSLPQEELDASRGSNSSVNTTVVPTVLFSAVNLDPQANHTLTVSYVGPGALGGPYVDFYYLMYTTSDSSSAGAGSSSPSSSPSPTNPSGVKSQSKSNAATIGGAVGGVCGGILVLAGLAFLLIRQRRKPQSDTSTVTPYTDGEGSSILTGPLLVPPSATSSKSPRPTIPSPTQMQTRAPGPPLSTIPSFFPAEQNVGAPSRIDMSVPDPRLSSPTETSDVFGAGSMSDPPPQYH
ncbi:hypothetical protein BD410DRAFT_742100 [Rickenella mellea]|uniref:Mid2 domain-containing protein n=1 Tax=Rickenella mellea TaxID=50990 RepID=A0A4Y7QH07_9AGAM|nr:hypothetical protein BD410DRAFT_742100 [Rickenella mellea]